MAPLAFLVYGPESSGNKLMHRILIDSGCAGSGTDDQPLPDLTASLIVWGRSVPSHGAWPENEIQMVRAAGYDVLVIVLQRNWACMAKSQVFHGYVRDELEAIRNIQAAYRHIFHQIDNTPYVIVSYEWLSNEQALAGLSWLLGIPLRVNESITNENLKWIK